MATVGVVGLGAMGSRIARRLGAAGHELVVWNRDPAKAESLVAAGALAAETPADAARRAEAGGAPEPVEHWLPVLSTLGTVFHLGPVGAGTAAKLVANTALVGVIGILGEALALAERLGLSRDAAFEVLGKTALAGQAERRRSAVESGEYPPRFALYLARKDADLILEAAAKKGLELRLTKAADEWLAEAENAGLGDKDYSAVLARILEGTSQVESSER